MGRLGDLADAKGWTPEDVRAEAQERLGIVYTQKTVDNYLSRKRLPKAWIEAFDLEPNPEPEWSEAPPYEPPGEPGSRRLLEDDQPAAPEPSAPSLGVVDPRAASIAEERLKAIHGMVGHGAAVALRSPGIDRVTEDFAPVIAKAWVQAAGEVAWARWLVDSISVGGAAGELVSCYMLWLGGILYIQGTIPSLGLYDKYSAYRGQLPEPAKAGGGGGEDPATVAAQNGGPAGWDPSREDSGAAVVGDPAPPSV